MSPDAPATRLLLICGSTRAGSSNSAALQAVQELAMPGVHTDRYESLRDLPAFVPDEQPVPPLVTDLLDRIRAADAVLICTPEYAGSLPGSLKNLLDWTVGGGELYDKRVGWLDVANPGRGAGARIQLGVVLGYVGAHVVTEACVHVAVERTEVGVRIAPAALPDLAAAVRSLLGR